MSLVRLPPAFVPPVVVPAANAIVPFVPPALTGTAGITGLIAGAPIPLVIGLGLGTGLLLGGALGQIWGHANNPRAGQWPWPFDQPDTDLSDFDDLGVLVPAVAGTTWTVEFPGRSGVFNIPTQGYGFLYFTFTSPFGQRFWVSQAVKADGTLANPVGFPQDIGGSAARPISAEQTWIIKSRIPGGDPVPATPSPGFVPGIPSAPVLPEPEPLPSPQPEPQRPRAVPPLTVPTIPGSRPTSPAPSGVPTPTTPRTSPPPATLPDRPLTPFPGWPVQPRVPGTATTPDGTLAPTPKTPVVKTPTDVHVIDGVPIPGNGPRPTPEGTAQELGRLEKKLASLLSPQQASPNDRISQLDDKLDILRLIWETLTSVTAGGQYEISSPCEVDENGDRVVRAVAYIGALNSFGVLSNKIDALAALLQEHKDLKQPICRQTPAVGQPVTVNFVQVD